MYVRIIPDYMSLPIVLVTGALSGIGRTTALACARDGTRVVVSGRRDDAGAALVAELRALGAEAELVRVDTGQIIDVNGGKTAS